jgi:hypothetical protein
LALQKAGSEPDGHLSENPDIKVDNVTIRGVQDIAAFHCLTTRFL